MNIVSYVREYLRPSHMSVAHIQYFRSCDANIEHEVVVLCGIKKLCWNDNGASLKYLTHGDGENILQHVLHCGQSRHISVKILLISASDDGGPHSLVCARETLRSAPNRH